MSAISRLFLWFCLTFIGSNCICQRLLPPFGGYQQDVSFPGISGQFQVASINERQPIRQVSAGFHLNSPPPLPFLQPIPFNQIVSQARNALKSENFLPKEFYNFPRNLFTPNTVKQRPESNAQEEAYRKYLEEEAENLEKEKQNNDITTDFADLKVEPIEATSVSPSQRTFVRVNVQGKDYSYST